MTAFSLTDGKPRVFKTDHSERLRAHGRYLARDVALASSAAPMYLPLVDLRDPATGTTARYCDGAMVANSPALMGYAEALSHMRVPASKVSLLSVGTPRADVAEPQSGISWLARRRRRGLMSWGFGERIITLALDGGAEGAHNTLRLLTEASGARYERVNLKQPAGTDLDCATPRVVEALAAVGVARARETGTFQSMTPFFVDGDGRS